jgi:hypothetical protein
MPSDCRQRGARNGFAIEIFAAIGTRCHQEVQGCLLAGCPMVPVTREEFS